MSDYIKREDAYRRLTEYYHHTREIQHESLRIALIGIPSADVEPVRHGRWEDYEENTWQCSECGELFYLEDGTPKENEYHYCPNCGARMDEEADA